MARSISEIEQVILDEKDNQGLDLTSDSATAVYGLWAYITAVAQWLHENLWDDFKAEVQAIIEAYHPGTAGWYQQQLLKFQNGDELIIIDNVPGYAVIDETKQTIKYAAVIDGTDGIVTMKIAKMDVNGLPVPFDIPFVIGEMAEIEAYMDKVKFAGTLTNLVSKKSDLLHIEGEVFYDANVEIDTIHADVELTIKEYLKSVSAKNINGVIVSVNGVVVLSDLIEQVKAVTGVYDFVLSVAKAKADGGTEQDIDRIWQTSAGYIKIDPDNDITFPGTITYTASNV